MMATKTVPVYENGKYVRDDQVEVPDPTPEELAEMAIRANLAAAIPQLRKYVASPTTTLLATVPTIQLLCRIAIWTIRLQLRQFDGTD